MRLDQILPTRRRRREEVGAGQRSQDAGILFVFMCRVLPASGLTGSFPPSLFPRLSSCRVAAVQVPTVGKNNYSSFAGFSHLAAGLACGLSSLAAGLAIGVVGDAGVRAVGQQPALYVGMILILIFGEALGLYGLIVALILSQKGGDPVC